MNAIYYTRISISLLKKLIGNTWKFIGITEKIAIENFINWCKYAILFRIRMNKLYDSFMPFYL